MMTEIEELKGMPILKDVRAFLENGAQRVTVTTEYFEIVATRKKVNGGFKDKIDINYKDRIAEAEEEG